MKSYKLTAWPDLPTAFLHVGYTRILTELSQRRVTEAGLRNATGMAVRDIRSFLEHLNSQGLLEVRDAACAAPPSRRFGLNFDSWLRRA